MGDVTAKIPAPTPSARAAAPRGPAVAGIELQAGTIRIVVGQRDGARLRVTGRGEAALPDGALVSGLVTDRFVVADALRTALASAEHLQRAERLTVAVDSDDMRTHHALTTFEREDLRAAVGAGEEQRAVREAASDAHSRAAAATEEDAAMRGVATVQLDDDVAAMAIDGRGLNSLIGHRGRLVEVWTDVTIAPLVVTGAVTATLEAVRRRGTVASGAYVLGRLIAESGVSDAGVVRLGSDMTAIGVLREGRVTGTRVFALGRSALAARPGRLEDDAKVWADCVVASLRGIDGPPPGRWLFIGVTEALLALPSALASTIGEIRGETADAAPLAVGLASRVVGDLRPEDLVAAGAAALAAGVYET